MKTCDLCGKEFNCSLDDNCWCMDLPVVTIPIKYQDCLCPTCLKEAHDQETRRTI